MNTIINKDGTLLNIERIKGEAGDDNQYLSFEYKEINFNKKFEIKSATKETYNLDYVEFEGDKYPIVSADNTIKDKLSRSDYDFSRHIFLEEVSFQSVIFTKQANFSGATFTEKANFRSATFKEEANFLLATFTEQAYFSSATFTEKADFLNATFTKEANFLFATFTEQADFSNATFTEQANFSFATFTEQANFSDATFKEKANFISATFKEKANFSFATFTEQANFEYATFTEQANFRSATFTEKADFRYVTFEEKANFEYVTFEKEVSFNFEELNEVELNFENSLFCDNVVFFLNTFSTDKTKLNLNLISIVILNENKFNFNDNFVKALSNSEGSQRETYRIFKNTMINRHSNIYALDMHKKEYSKYLSEINKKWSTEYIILYFEKKVSEFGTNVLKSIFYWIVTLYLFAALITIVGIGLKPDIKHSISNYEIKLENESMNILVENKSTDDLNKKIIMYATQPISIFSDNSFLREYDVVIMLILLCLNFSKTIFLGALTYEIIKSFRKYSRKF